MGFDSDFARLIADGLIEEVDGIVQLTAKGRAVAEVLTAELQIPADVPDRAVVIAQRWAASWN